MFGLKKTALLFVLAGATFATGCYGTYYGTTQSHDHRSGPGADYCPARLPAAQNEIQTMYTRIDGRRSAYMQETVTSRDGAYYNVSVATDSRGDIQRHSVQTGLTDIIIDCRDNGRNANCFVDIYLDGDELTSMSPTTDGRVPFRCVPSGERRLVIEHVGDVVYDADVVFDSDTEYEIDIIEASPGDFRVNVHTRDRLADRMPPVPGERDRGRADLGDHEHDDHYDGNRDRDYDRDRDRYRDYDRDDRADRRADRRNDRADRGRDNRNDRADRGRDNRNDRADRRGDNRNDRANPGRDNRNDRADRRGDNRNDRTDRRGDNRNDRADRGRDNRDDRADRGGDNRDDRADRRGDNRNDRADRGGDNRNDRADRRGDNRNDRADRRGDNRNDRADRRGDNDARDDARANAGRNIRKRNRDAKTEDTEDKRSAGRNIRKRNRDAKTEDTEDKRSAGRNIRKRNRDAKTEDTEDKRSAGRNIRKRNRDAKTEDTEDKRSAGRNIRKRNVDARSVDSSSPTADDKNTVRSRRPTSVGNSGSDKNRRAKRMPRGASSTNTASPMSSSEFDELLERVRRESRQRLQHGLMRDAIRRNYFTSKQASRLVRELTKTSLKTNAAESFYPKVVDKQNYGLVLGQFGRSDRQKVENAIGWEG
ncbi:MAG: DUF4476 domain-containing protein [Myxococcota bacterium]